MTIAPVSLVGLGPISPSSTASTGSTSFENVLGQAIQGLATNQQNADQQAQALATGQNVSLVDTVLSSQQVSLDFQLAMQVRDQLLQAYQSVMQTQV